jgi:hypothetical protein
MSNTLSAHYPVASPAEASRPALWAGRVLTLVVGALLLMDATMKIAAVPEAVEGTQLLGYRASVLFPLGLTQLICLALYLYPRTSVFGAILWTGYLGGAVATHVRIGNPLYSHILSPVYVATLLWFALWLRDTRLRTLLPLTGTRGK